jgi:hypothetical protein
LWNVSIMVARTCERGTIGDMERVSQKTSSKGNWDARPVFKANQMALVSTPPQYPGDGCSGRSRHTEITDAGLEHLKGLSALQTLYLNDTKVTDTGLACLKGLTRLSNLNFAGTKVIEAGAQELKKALPKVRIFR